MAKELKLRYWGSGELCKHCTKCTAYGPNGLCVRCFSNLQVKDMINISDLPLVDPRGPTNAIPGTPEKIEVLRQRAENGWSLWHPLDKTMDDVRKETINFGLLKCIKSQKKVVGPSGMGNTGNDSESNIQELV